MGLSDIFEFIYDNTITDDPVLMENTKTMIDNINISSLLNIDKDISKQFLFMVSTNFSFIRYINNEEVSNSTVNINTDLDMNLTNQLIHQLEVFLKKKQ